jgi:HEPN domain-containing protein/ribosomal protein S27AE
VGDELEQELSKLDLDQLKSLIESYGIECSDCETKDEYINCISDSQNVTVENIRSQFDSDFVEFSSEEGDNMPGFEDAEKLIKETKTKFDSGDYNASIDLATEAIGAGANALDSLLGMGLSYAIKSSEKLLLDLKNMDIETSSVEDVLESARDSLENKEYGSTKNIVSQLKESFSDLSQKQGERIIELLNTAQSQIDEAKEMGSDTANAEQKLKLAREQANTGAYIQALSAINESETLVNSAKEAQIAKINEMIIEAETKIEEAKYVNANVDEANGFLEKARDSYTNQEYALALENANSAVGSANTSRDEQIKRVMKLQEKMTATSAIESSEEQVSEEPSEASFEVEEPKEEPEAQIFEDTEEEAVEAPLKETEKVCPTCQGEPTWVEQYDRWFCYTCNDYITPKEKEVKEKEEAVKEKAPEGVSAEVDMICGKCEDEPTWVEQYDKWFCYTCNEYIEPVKKGTKEKAASAAPAAKEQAPKGVSAEVDMICGKCESDPTWVEQYDKWFCYTCNEYIEPVEKKAQVKKEKPKVKESAKVCPTCSGEPTYVEQYDKWFCYTCNEYVEPSEKKAQVKKEMPKAQASAKVCPTCSGEPTYVEQYDRWFCYTCNEYVEPSEKKAQVKKEMPKAQASAKVCPTCSGEPTYVEQYKRYYCYTCNDYVEPKQKAAVQSKNACPTCGKEATYVEQYGRYYCYDCSNYV